MPHTHLHLNPLPARVRRSTQIAEDIRHLIHNGTLKTGDKLPTEADLCKQYGVSRTTLREAVQVLRSTGLLDVTPGRGSFIKTPDCTLLLTELTRQHSAHPQHIGHLYTVLGGALIAALANQNISNKRDVARHKLSPHHSPESNLKTERAWLQNLATLCGNSALPLLITMLHALDAPNRRAHFETPETLATAIESQHHTNTAIMYGAWQQAAQGLVNHFTLQAHYHNINLKTA